MVDAEIPNKVQASFKVSSPSPAKIWNESVMSSLITFPFFPTSDVQSLLGERLSVRAAEVYGN